MTLHGRILNGTIILDELVALPDGTEVQVDIAPVVARFPEISPDQRAKELREVAERIDYDFEGFWQSRGLPGPHANG